VCGKWEREGWEGFMWKWEKLGKDGNGGWDFSVRGCALRELNNVERLNERGNDRIEKRGVVERLGKGGQRGVES
jgi:hypothetical protein